MTTARVGRGQAAWVTSARLISSVQPGRMARLLLSTSPEVIMSALRGSGLLALVLLASVPTPASACGGFFCSSRPVVQSAERVVYVLEDDGSLSMSVEISYGGVDDDFAWILPVPTPPTISLGTTALFDALDVASRPSFGYEQRVHGTCRDYPLCLRRGEEPPVGSCPEDTLEGPMRYEDSRTEPPPPVELPPPSWEDGGITLYAEAPVGPYDTVVLGSSSADAVIAWLRDHGYDVPAESGPLLSPYAAMGHVFVALRLSANRADDTLRPVTLRFAPGADGTAAEACLPLRLTPIASAPSLPIVAFFLAAAPVTSRNFARGEIDLEDPRFWLEGRTWSDAVAEAVAPFDGRAFVTDYAGRTPDVSLALPSVADLATESSPDRFIRALVARGYPPDDELLELLELYLVPPIGTFSTSYYNCLAAADGCGSPVRFQPAELAAGIMLRITEPRLAAEAMVARRPRLTRLSTVLSPAQMTVDPIFVADAGLPDVGRLHPAVLVTQCSDAYYGEDAPWALMRGEGTALDLRAGGRAIASSPGTLADPAAYCARFDATPGVGPASEAARRCGYRTGCSASGEVGRWAGALALIVTPWFVWRARMRRPV